MLVTENIEINGKNFRKVYSDAKFYIARDDVKYVEAIDPIEFAEERVYIETDEPIEIIEPQVELVQLIAEQPVTEQPVTE